MLVYFCFDLNNKAETVIISVATGLFASMIIAWYSEIKTYELSDLEELTSNSVLFYLCRARLIWGDYNEEQIRDIMYSVSKEEKKIRRSVDYIMRMRNHFLKKHGDGSNSDDS